LAYITDPEFVDGLYEVPTISDLVARQGVIGVVRYVEFPAFAPERLFTLVYRADRIEVSSAVGASSLWYSLYRESEQIAVEPGESNESEPFDAGRVWRRSAVVALPCQACPPALQSWESVRAAAARAGGCETNTCDGITYRHRVADRTSEAVTRWNNPDRRAHVAQVSLIKAYVGLLEHAAVYPRVR
jgi:hypothetical protein